MTRAYFALGSNLGDRVVRLQQAVDGLRATAGIEVVGVSRVYETDPVGGPPQGAYLNAAVALETSLGARRLLEVAQRLEAAAGRDRETDRVRWGPRELDVDVLLCGDEAIEDDDLVVPHPRMGERPFVLAPLADLAPHLPVVVEAVRRFAGRWPGVRLADVELSVT